jgi:hypothetical protein
LPVVGAFFLEEPTAIRVNVDDLSFALNVIHGGDVGDCQCSQMLRTEDPT